MQLQLENIRFLHLFSLEQHAARPGKKAENLRSSHSDLGTSLHPAPTLLWGRTQVFYREKFPKPLTQGRSVVNEIQLISMMQHTFEIVGLMKTIILVEFRFKQLPYVLVIDWLIYYLMISPKVSFRTRDPVGSPSLRESSQHSNILDMPAMKTVLLRCALPISKHPVPDPRFELLHPPQVL